MEKKHAWADLEYISGIPSEELFERLLNDTIFVDYLNTFLSLPVFGKRFCYNRADDKFSIEPSPPRTYYHLPRNFVKEWIRKERLKFFCKTDLFLQYLLCAYLQEGCESSNTSMDRYQFRWYLGTVESMRSFQRFLLGTMGQRILFFWIDAARFRRVTKKEHRRFAFRDIQSKYLQSGSPWELPEIMKWASLCGVSDDLGKRSSFKFPKSVLNRMYLCDASIFAENVFVCGQKMAVDRLVCYWVPKFIQRKKKIRGILEEKRLRQSLCGSQTITLKPVSEVVPKITVTKNASQEEIDIFMDAHCVSSTESVEEKDDEIRARRLEEWKRWFWEGVDEDIQSENEKVVELPEYVPEELRQLGGIKEFSSSCFVTPEKGKASVDVGGDQNVSKSPREMDGSPKDKIYSRSLCSPPKSLPSSPKEGSLSEPKFSTTSLLESYQWHENIHIKPRNLKQENQHESEEAKRVNLPRLPQPYALLPTTTHRKPKTQYEALASKQRTDQGTKELRKLSPKRSTSASPPQTAILALERASVSHVIPFREVGNEIAAIIGEPRNAYPTESPLPEQLSRMGESSRAGLFSDIYFTDESASLALMVLTGDKLAGGPLREYLEKTRNKKALRSLQFWEDAQRYLSPADDFGSFNKFHMAKTLVATYIAPDSPRQLPISRSIRDDLMRLLPGEKGDHLLTSVVDECIQEVVSPWSEYVRSDEDHFISSVAMRRKVGSELTNVKAAKMWTKVRALKERKAFFPEDTGSKFRALALAARLGVNAIVGSDDVDNEEAEALNYEFKIPSLKDHEKEREELSARNKGIPHFYGQTFKKGEDTAEATKKTAPTKMKTPKPRSFADILFEPVQLNGFKKFLAEKNAEAPMAFWQAVENMKTNCKDGKARLARAATIVRKFFINIPTSAVEYLNCKADIIRDIPTLDKVTPPMLISAQACVSRSIEENWFSEYIATFPEDENEGESFASYAMRDTLAGVFKMTGHGKTIGLWRMVAHSITLLLHGIHNPELLEEFKQFLRRETKATIEQNLKRHAPHPARRMVNSKLVSVDRLISDVEFWLEVERFKNLADHAAQCARSGNYTLEDENLLIDKAKAIVRCFIDSDVPPRLQVNIANETAESIVALVKSDIIERGLFHNAAMSVFIPLMFFWKKFSAERISNPAEKVIQSAYSAGANKRPITRGSTHSLICGMPYKRVYMSTDDDIFWSYSLHHGLRLMLPHKFAIAKQDAAQLGRRSTGLSDALSLPRPTP